MNKLDKQYTDLLQDILDNGVTKQDRTGTGTLSLFGRQIRHKMSDGFPILTTKKIPFRLVVTELLWFLKGDTNIKYLLQNDCNIWSGDCYKRYWFNWRPIKEDCGDDLTPYTQEEFINKIKTDDEFAKKWGELGPIYGKQWRNWDIKPNIETKSYIHKGETHFTFDINERPSIDQIANLINDLKTNPDDRGLIVSAWNVADLKSMVLRPCHNFFQCYTYEMSEEERLKEWCHSLGKDISYAEDMTERKLDALRFPKRKLSLKINIRSNDVFLGCPFNISSYGLLLHLLSDEVNMIPDELIVTIGDAHIYLNHIEQVKLQINLPTFKLPTIQISKKSIFDIEYDDIKLLGYKSGPAIKGELSN
jgi:thymidylate synthase